MEHHERAIAAYVATVRDDPAALAVIVVGSVARGTERPDSDVDLYLIVDDGAFADALARNRLSWTERRDADYPGGYVDVKLASPRVLAVAAESGDDPMRASFEGARIAFRRAIDLGIDLEGVLEAVTRLPDAAWDERVRAQLAQARIHGGYFLPQAAVRGDAFLRHHAATHLALAAARAALAERRTLLRGPKYVAETLERLDLPDGFLERWRRLVERPTAESGARLLGAVEDWLGPEHDADDTLSTFIRDNELAWLSGRIPPEYR
jgi:predicted nucleotidyltransferase